MKSLQIASKNALGVLGVVTLLVSSFFLLATVFFQVLTSWQVELSLAFLLATLSSLAVVGFVLLVWVSYQDQQ